MKNQKNQLVRTVSNAEEFKELLNKQSSRTFMQPVQYDKKYSYPIRHAALKDNQTITGNIQDTQSQLFGALQNLVKTQKGYEQVIFRITTNQEIIELRANINSVIKAQAGMISVILKLDEPLSDEKKDNLPTLETRPERKTKRYETPEGMRGLGFSLVKYPKGLGENIIVENISLTGFKLSGISPEGFKRVEIGNQLNFKMRHDRIKAAELSFDPINKGKTFNVRAEVIRRSEERGDDGRIKRTCGLKFLFENSDPILSQEIERFITFISNNHS